MTGTFMQTMPPLEIVFNRLPRREVVRVYDARQTSPPKTTKWRIVKVWAEALALSVIEDIAGAIRSAVSPPAVYQLGGLS